VQRVDLPLVGEQLHDDDRAGEAKAQGDEQRRHRRQAQGKAEPHAHQGGEQDLAEAGDQSHGPHRTDQAHVEPEAHQKQEHGDADAGEQLQLAATGSPAQSRRPHQDAGEDVADDQRLAEFQGYYADHARQHQDRRQLVKHGAEGHGCRRLRCRSV
jgi:hypothetical protein